MNKPPRLDLNPSSAERWTTCTASPHFILENWDKLPPDTSKYAQEGTTAHEVGAALLQEREPKVSECPTPIDGEMRWHAWEYSEYVNGLREPGNKMVVETKFPLWYMPNRNALVDVAILNPTNAHIVDLKYGEGIIVSPVENLQGAIYARSVLPHLWEKHPGDKFPVTIHIYQPRGRDMTQPHHTWETTWGELVSFTSDRVEKPSRLILRPKGSDDWGDVRFAPSDKACQWCPAKGFCKARQEFLTDGISNLDAITVESFDGSEVKLSSPDTLSQDQLTLVQTHGDDIIKWVKDVQDYNTERMKAGHPLPGFKLVLSNGGHRYYTNQKEAIRVILEQTILKRDEIVEEKLISPAQIESKIGKKKIPADLMNLIDKPPGSPVIAPMGDKRPAIAEAAAIFENLEEQSSDTAE